jgi:cephalosporin hydroxylase
MDLSRVNILKQASIDDLNDLEKVENMILALGTNAENPYELPSSMIQNAGGIKIWQYPNQFSKYLLLLKTLNVKSYIEIGCRWGGTFILTREYLSRFNKLDAFTAVDIIGSPVKEYCDTHAGAEFIQLNSQSPEFGNFIKDKFYDVAFIDGDHSYTGVMRDYELCNKNANVIVFHDIVSDACPGVVQFWNDIKETEEDTYDFHEFIEQYDEVFERTGKRYLGIGVAVRKTMQSVPSRSS